MTDEKKPWKRKPAPPNHRIYQLGYVIGSIGRNRLPETVRRDLQKPRT